MDESEQKEVGEITEQIQWLEGLNEETKEKLWEYSRRFKPHEAVFKIMDMELNRINSSLPQVVADNLLEELIGYREFISQMELAFEHKYPKARRKYTSDVLKIAKMLERSRIAIKDESLEQAKSNFELLRHDGKGLILAFALTEQAAKRYGKQSGRYLGIKRAAERYRELYQAH